MLDDRLSATRKDKETVAAHNSYLDVERHVKRPASEPVGTTADGRPLGHGPGYAIGSERMPVHTGVMPQRWVLGPDKRLMTPEMWDDAMQRAEESRGSDRAASRQSSWRRSSLSSAGGELPATPITNQSLLSDVSGYDVADRFEMVWNPQ